MIQLMETRSDLRWPVNSFKRPAQALSFFEQFNDAFAVYSRSVKKIYTSYDVTLVNGSESVLVIEPDLLDYTSMFHGITQEAIVRSSVMLFVENGERYLSAVLEDGGARMTFSLRDGMYKLFNGDFIDGAFLPVITYGDLRVLSKHERPILQLHKLDISQLSSLSRFQVQDLMSALQDNIIERLAD